jgi:hypothetical protein
MIDEAILLILGMMFTHRLSLMLSSEEGPLALFAKMRRKVPPKTNPGRGIRCFFCVSVWVAGVVTIFFVTQKVVLPLWSPIVWLAVSSGAICIHAKFTKSK